MKLALAPVDADAPEGTVYLDEGAYYKF